MVKITRMVLTILVIMKTDLGHSGPKFITKIHLWTKDEKSDIFPSTVKPKIEENTDDTRAVG
jgi:hypothetical protein